MGYRITKWPGFLEIEHSGLVSYANRLAALAAVSEACASETSERYPLLINLTGARLIDDLQSDNRVDYMATVITQKFFDGRRVAMAGVTQSQAGTAMIAAAVRQTEFRVFDDRESAVTWLTQNSDHRTDTSGTASESFF